MLLLFLLIFGVFERSGALDCYISYPISALPNNCTTMYGSFETNASVDITYEILTQKFSTVQKWYGEIHIFNTNFEDLGFFASLEYVYFDWLDIYFNNDDLVEFYYATFWIRNNTNLKSLKMPKLKTIIANVLPTEYHQHSIYINKNPNLCLTETEHTTLRELDRSIIENIVLCTDDLPKKYCYRDFFTGTNFPQGCQILMSGIWMRDEKNTSYQESINQALSTVEEVYGPIVIFQTNYTNLSFPQLTTIRNQYYDSQNSWQWQVLIIRGNKFMTSIEFPKLTNFHHFGNQYQVTVSNNIRMPYSEQNCNLYRRIPFFSVTDDYYSCGLVPIINDGTWDTNLMLQAAEKIASIFCNTILAIFIAVKTYQTKIDVNFFHFALTALVLVNIVEALYINLNYIEIFNKNGFGIPFGIQFIYFSIKKSYLSQISNAMYVNRLSLVIVCSLHRCLLLISESLEKYGLVLSTGVFVIANIMNMRMLEETTYQYTFILYQLNYACLLISLISAIYLKVFLPRYYPSYTQIITQQNNLSIFLVLQAMWSFLIHGFSDGLAYTFQQYTAIPRIVNYRNWFMYWYGSAIYRWHYLVFGFITLYFISDIFVKFPTRAKITSVSQSTTSRS